MAHVFKIKDKKDKLTMFEIRNKLDIRNFILANFITQHDSNTDFVEFEVHGKNVMDKDEVDALIQLLTEFKTECNNKK